MQFEPLPEKRPVPSFVRKMPAKDALLELMKSDATQREALQRELARERKRADDLAVSLALQVYRKRGSEDATIRALLALLADRQIQLLTYEGQALTAELERAADIVEWLPAEGNETECVAEAIEPEIRDRERILHRAKLSCRKAPEVAEDPENPAEQQSPAGQAPPATKNARVWDWICARWGNLLSNKHRSRGEKTPAADRTNHKTACPTDAEEGSKSE